MEKVYYCYLFGTEAELMEVGATSKLKERIEELKKTYQKGKLLFFDTFANAFLSATMVKDMEKIKEADKFEMIMKKNPDFDDLIEFWKE